MFNKEECSIKFAERLKELREKGGKLGKKLSHATLASCLEEKIKKQSLQNYEAPPFHPTHGYSNMGMSVENLCRLADFYGVSTDYLLGRSDVLSDDVIIQKIIEKTGLTEENVHLLLTDPKFFYLYFYNEDHKNFFSTVMYLGEEGYRKLANDLVGMLRNTMFLVRYKELLGIHSKFKDIGAAPFDDEWITFSDIENLSKVRGFATVPVRDGISFYAAQLAAEIQQEFEEKYAVPERRRKEVKEIINGKEYTLYVE